mgnify:CR=1 FL=1
MVKLRYAPSPTGYMHLGNFYVLIKVYLFARKNNGHFILRIDDTDKSRNKDEYINGIYEDCKWLNIHIDETFKQSDRVMLYDKYFQKLIDLNHVYECFESKEEIEAIQTSKRRRRIAPIFTEGDKRTSGTINTGYWRSKLKDTFTVNDEIFGTLNFKRDWSDPIIKKTDGSYSYLFASVVDDLECGITHLIRGADHLANTAIQEYMGNILGNWSMKYYHFPLMKNNDSKLSKRDGENSLHEYKDLHPMTLWSMFSIIGTGLKPIISLKPEDYWNNWDINMFKTGSVQMPEYEKFIQINRKILRLLDESELNSQGINIHIWECFKYNIDTIPEFLHIQQNILSMDIYKLPYWSFFKSRYNNQNCNINMLIDEYILIHNLVQNDFLYQIRYDILRERSGPQSQELLLMLLKVF